MTRCRNLASNSLLAAALVLIAAARDSAAQQENEAGAPLGVRGAPGTTSVVRPGLPSRRLTPALPPGAIGPGPPGVSTPASTTQPVPSPIPEEARLQSNIDYEPFPGGGRFQFNLQDVDLPVLVRIISNLTGRSFIIGARARAIKATIYSPVEVTAAEAYRAFLAVLQANGMTVVPAGRYWVVTEAAGAAQEAVSTYRDGEAMPVEARMVTRIHRLSNVGADEMANILNRFKSRDGDVTPYAPTNTIIVTDFATNIRRLLLIVQELDVPGTGERIWVERIHYADAQELAQKIQEVFEASGLAAAGRQPGQPAREAPKPPGSRGPAGEPQREGEAVRLTRVIPEPRTNSIIIVATEPAYRQVLEMVARLDIPVPGEGEIHVHPLQHADAEELASTLNSLTTGSARPPRGGRGAAGGPPATAPGEALSGQVRIQSDTATNALVIVATPRDYAALRQVIAQLDIPRRQVFVEAVIMEVSLEKMRRVGISFHGGDMVETGDEESLMYGGFFPLQTIAIDPNALTGLALGMRGWELAGSDQTLVPGISIPAFGVLLSALQTDNDVDILSTPNILATDNVPAEIMVGGSVPVQQGGMGGLGGLGALAGLAGQQGGTAGGLGGLGGFNPWVSVGYQKVGITLKITPQINESDQVRLEIELEVSEVTGETALGPTISQKTAKTTSVVRDQQTVVIGGLITDNEVETVEKIPLLGDIPILGHLFRHTTTRITKRNLLIFLTPYIIRDSSDFRRIFNRKMQERREFIEMVAAFRDREWSPDIDYERTDGLLEEINRTVGEMEREEEVRRRLELVPPPAHRPSEPISAARWERMVGPGYVEIGPDAPEGHPGEARGITFSPGMMPHPAEGP